MRFTATNSFNFSEIANISHNKFTTPSFDTESLLSDITRNETLDVIVNDLFREKKPVHFKSWQIPAK